MPGRRLSTQSEDELEAFIRYYSGTFHGDLAKLRLEELRKTAAEQREQEARRRAVAAKQPPSTSRPASSNTKVGVLLGTRSVGFAANRDIIGISPKQGKFSKVGLRVLNNDIFVRDMRVVYASGGSDLLLSNSAIPAGGESAPSHQWRPAY